MGFALVLALAGWGCWRFRRYKPWLYSAAGCVSGMLLLLAVSEVGARLPERRLTLGLNVLLLVGSVLVMAKTRREMANAGHWRSQVLLDLRTALSAAGAGREPVEGPSSDSLRQASAEDARVASDFGAAIVLCLLVTALNVALILARKS